MIKIGMFDVSDRDLKKDRWKKRKSEMTEEVETDENEMRRINLLNYKKRSQIKSLIKIQNNISQNIYENMVAKVLYTDKLKNDLF